MQCLRWTDDKVATMPRSHDATTPPPLPVALQRPSEVGSLLAVGLATAAQRGAVCQRRLAAEASHAASGSLGPAFPGEQARALLTGGGWGAAG